MKSKLRLMAVALIAGGTMFAQSRLSVGVGVGGYGPSTYPPPAYAQYRPPCPGPGYAWVDGYWTPQGGHNAWIAGYWRRPVVVAPRYVEPRHDNAYRGNERGDYERDRRNDKLSQNRGGGRDKDDDRGNSFSSGFRR